MKIRVTFLYFLSFILVFFPMFVIYIKEGTNGNITIAFIFLCATYISFIKRNKKKYEKYLGKLFKLPIIKYYLFYMGFVLLTTLVHVFLGRYTAPASFYAVRIYKFYAATILVYFLPVLSIFAGIKIKTILKLFYSIIWGILFASIIQYISFIFNITFIQLVFNFFANARTALYTNSSTAQEALRVYAFFDEPSALGQFIFIVMPFIINFNRTKYKLYNKNISNFIIKNSFIPLMLVVIFLTKSPIYIFLCMTEFLITTIYHQKHLLKKKFVLFVALTIVFFTFIAILSIFRNQDIVSQSFLSRIQATVECFGDFDKLVEFEPSLATRIVSYSAQLVAFTKNIFFGCGLYNVEVFFNKYFIQETPLPLTLENYYLGYMIQQYVVNFNRSIVYTSLAEFGIVGCFLYVLFIIKNIKFINKIKIYFSGIEGVFLNSLSQVFITISIISFYNLNIQNYMIWLIFGFVLLYLYILFYKSAN